MPRRRLRFRQFDTCSQRVARKTELGLEKHLPRRRRGSAGSAKTDGIGDPRLGGLPVSRPVNVLFTGLRSLIETNKGEADMLIYKIHPAIGVARVGDSPESFFIGPEKPGDLGVEIAKDGAETPIADHKAAGKIKRQGARFRVFEYDKDDTTGALTLKREITADDAQIEWKVDLVNRKAAFDRVILPGIDPEVAPKPRNTDLTGAAQWVDHPGHA